jgi:hypothetical protein
MVLTAQREVCGRVLPRLQLALRVRLRARVVGGQTDAPNHARAAPSSSRCVPRRWAAGGLVWDSSTRRESEHGRAVAMGKYSEYRWMVDGVADDSDRARALRYLSRGDGRLDPVMTTAGTARAGARKPHLAAIARSLPDDAPVSPMRLSRLGAIGSAAPGRASVPAIRHGGPALFELPRRCDNLSFRRTPQGRKGI